MGIVLRSRDRAFFWKIAYDEAFAAQSPGVQLALETTQIQQADKSCWLCLAGRAATPIWLGGCAIGCPARSQDGKLNNNLAQQLLQLRPECRRDVLARQREGGIGGEETEAGAAIIGDAIEAHAMKTVFLGEGEHRIRQLDLAP
jgi:Acetyltransferase (GNAT) domain